MLGNQGYEGERLKFWLFLKALSLRELNHVSKTEVHGFWKQQTIKWTKFLVATGTTPKSWFPESVEARAISHSRKPGEEQESAPRRLQLFV